jgi:hypothetical protein
MGSTVSLSLSKGDDDCGRDYHTGWRQICWLVMALDEAGEEKLNTRHARLQGLLRQRDDPHSLQCRLAGRKLKRKDSKSEI